MRVRQRLHPHRRYLKWLRQVARWQMRWLPVQAVLKRRFARWVNLLTTDPGEEVIWRFPGTQLRFALELNEEAQSEMYYFGAFQPEIVRVFTRSIRPDRIFVDVGAHIGQYTLWAADYYRRHQVAEHPVVFAFEPNPRTFSRLQRNISINSLDSYVSAHELALSDRNGIAPFYPAIEARSGGSSLASHAHDPYHAQSGDKITVTSMSLDNFFQQQPLPAPLGLVKMDIEGAELLALRGASTTLSTYRPAIILEVYSGWMKSFGYTYHDLRKFLISLGYSIYVIQSDTTLIPETTGRLSHTQFYDLVCYPS